MFMQVNTRWKALDEIYKVEVLLHLSDPTFQQNKLIRPKT